MTFDKNYKILKNYKNKKEFLSVSRKSLFDSIKEICKEDLAIKIRNKGYNKMHHYFPVDYLPFLNFLLKKKTEKYIYNFIANTAYEDLKMKKPFYIDKVANYRVHYPFTIAKKSRLSRSVFRLLDLKNYNNPEYEVKKSITNQNNYQLQETDKSKINYFGKLPVPCYGHSPHRDTWFGHTYGAINLWWSVAGVTKRTGLLLYPKVNKYHLTHTINPSYVKDGYRLGKITSIGLKDGELLAFDPEILHGTRLNNSDDTRIVFSGRLNPEKPKFYENTMAVEYPHWLRSDEVRKGNYDKTFTFFRKDNLSRPKKEKVLKKEVLKKINIDSKISPNKIFKFRNSNSLKKQKVFKIIFKNTELTVIKKSRKFLVFNSLCPHLKYDLSFGHVEKFKITCPGHGLNFDLKKGVSECKSFKLKKYNLKLEKNFFHLIT